MKKSIDILIYFKIAIDFFICKRYNLFRLISNQVKGGVHLGFPETFKALSDPARREILVMLRGGKMSAGEIGKAFDMTGATISYHLTQLKKAGLITETKYKNYIFYELNASVFEEVMMWFSQFGGSKDEK